MEAVVDENAGLARAILDLELKMKHEIRQNNAVQLTRMEKYYQMLHSNYIQMDNRMSLIETKLEALLSRELAFKPPPQFVHHPNGNRLNPPATKTVGRSTLRYHRLIPDGGSSSSRANSRAKLMPLTPTLGQQPSMPTPMVPQVSQPYGVFGRPSPQQHKSATTKMAASSPNIRPKQMLGTRSQNKAQAEGKMPSANAWTSRAGGIYTDESDGDDQNSRTDSGSVYSVARPDRAQQKDDGREKEQQLSGKLTVLKLGTAKEDKDLTKTEKELIIGNVDLVSEKGAKKTSSSSGAAIAGTSNSNSDVKADNQKTSTATSGTTITPATIGTGGFGRSRRKQQ